MSLFVVVRACEDSCCVSIKSSTAFPAMSFEVRLSIAHMHMHTAFSASFVIFFKLLFLGLTTELALFLNLHVRRRCFHIERKMYPRRRKSSDRLF